MEEVLAAGWPALIAAPFVLMVLVGIARATRTAETRIEAELEPVPISYLQVPAADSAGVSAPLHAGSVALVVEPKPTSLGGRLAQVHATETLVVHDSTIDLRDAAPDVPDSAVSVIDEGAPEAAPVEEPVGPPVAEVSPVGPADDHHRLHPYEPDGSLVSQVQDMLVEAQLAHPDPWDGIAAAD